METILINGTELKKKKMESLKNRVSELSQKGIKPHLVVVQVGDDAASTIYIRNKEKMALDLGMEFTKCSLPSSVSFEELKTKVEGFNNDKLVDGIIIQFPLPKSFGDKPVNTLIDPNKDADGIHPLNQGINLTRENKFSTYPCTPSGIMEMFKEYNISLSGKNALVIGRSNIVGRPMGYMLANENATVTMAHSRTTKEDMERAIKNADIIVSATGVPGNVRPELVKEGVVIIDVGIIRGEDGKLRGDVLHKDFIGKAGFITPVPGGVGPMTVTMLMQNTILLADKNRSK